MQFWFVVPGLVEEEKGRNFFAETAIRGWKEGVMPDFNASERYCASYRTEEKILSQLRSYFKKTCAQPETAFDMDAYSVEMVKSCAEPSMRKSAYQTGNSAQESYAFDVRDGDHTVHFSYHFRRLGQSKTFYWIELNDAKGNVIRELDNGCGSFSADITDRPELRKDLVVVASAIKAMTGIDIEIWFNDDLNCTFMCRKKLER